MLKKSILYVIGIIFVSTSARSDTYTLDNWDIGIYNSYRQEHYKPSRTGGDIPYIGLGYHKCIQQPISVFKDRNFDLQEEIRITCEVGFSDKVTLIQSCYVNKPDSSFGALRVESGFDKFTISLKCSN